YSLMLRWSAGHSRIDGNERVDASTKSAATGNSSAASDLPGPACLRKRIPRSASAIKHTEHEKLKKNWLVVWKESPRCDKYRCIGLAGPSKAYIKMV
ncbi:hypothetical protein BC834DRAFT_793056, partial [Gloeopeniophorella convolvens]